jgi:hypothetical protein
MVALHGKETVVPEVKLPEALKQDSSIVKKMDLTSQNLQSALGNKNDMSDVLMMIGKSFGSLESKIDELIYAVQNGNDTRQKILKYSKV